MQIHKNKSTHQISSNQRMFNIKSLNNNDITQIPYNRLNFIDKIVIQEDVKIIINNQINNFFQNIITIINKYQLDKANILNYVRQNVLYKQIRSISPSLSNRFKVLQNQNKKDIKNDITIPNYRTKTQINIRGQQQFDENAFKNNQSYISIQQNKSKYQNNIKNIYDMARGLNFLNFQKQYKEIQKNNKIELFNIKHVNKPAKNKANKEGYLNSKTKIITKIIQFFSYKYTPSQNKELYEFLQKQLDFQCKNPCCKWSQDKISRQISTFSLAHSNTRPKVNKPFQMIYQNDKVQEYYSRYYYNKQFNIENIKNLPKTKGQQIQKLYKQYMTKQKYANKIRNKAHFRNQSIK